MIKVFSCYVSKLKLDQVVLINYNMSADIFAPIRSAVRVVRLRGRDTLRTWSSGSLMMMTAGMIQQHRNLLHPPHSNRWGLVANTYFIQCQQEWMFIFFSFLLLQDLTETEGPVVEKIMGLRSGKKQVRHTRNYSFTQTPGLDFQKHSFTPPKLA